ncbi:hypothetical protein BSKO_04668 [Bryopsis sp. KO-2023]|nr:hypothetical protein BSKO_04668 [Bryopsis sp. KO-2023]
MLAGKCCVVTGASRGIGKTIATSFSKEKASLILVSRSKEKLEQVAKECKGHGAEKVETFSVDLADTAAVDSFTDTVLKSHGGVDVLVNNAGGFGSGGNTPKDGDPDDWDEMMKVNLLAPMRLTRRFSPSMVEKSDGAIINICSVAGVEPMTNMCAYAASKWGMRGWSLSCYENLRRDNIKVCCINPAMVRTEMTAKVGAIPENMMDPEDVAEAALFVVRTSSKCCPQDITLRLTKSAFG